MSFSYINQTQLTNKLKLLLNTYSVIMSYFLRTRARQQLYIILLFFYCLKSKKEKKKCAPALKFTRTTKLSYIGCKKKIFYQLHKIWTIKIITI